MKHTPEGAASSRIWNQKARKTGHMLLLDRDLCASVVSQPFHEAVICLHHAFNWASRQELIADEGV